MPPSSILLLEADRAEAERVEEILRHAGHAVEIAADREATLHLAASHGVLLVDLPGDGTEAAALIHEVRANPSTAALPVLCFAQTRNVDERVRLLEAGSDDVIVRPYDARELEARVEALTLRYQRSGGTPPAPSPAAVVTRQHQVVAFFGAKGGVGTTTITVNVAVGLAGRHPGEVALLDLALPLGQVPTHLDLKPRHQLTDLLAEPDADGVHAAAEQYADTLDVFCLPDDPEEADRLSATDLTRALEALRAVYLFTVVDAGSALGARAIAGLGEADRIVLITLPEIPSLRALVAVEHVLNERGLADRTVHVVNHLFAHEPLKLADIEDSLGTTIALEVPHHDLLFARAVNEGVPVVRAAPRSEPAERLARLASIVAGTAEPAPEPEKPRRRFGLPRRARD
ncbi:MAG: AAA family ATPase [Candidatus Limnocylindrales bacterium]